MSLILAFDVGTSSLRTALYQRNGRLLQGSLAQAAYPLNTGRDGKAELTPRRLLAAAKHCLGRTLDWKARSGRWRHASVAAVGMSCFWHSLLGVDRDGKPLTPIYTWADSRGLECVRALRQSMDARAVHEATGCMLHTSYWPAKLEWLRRQQLGRRDYRQVHFWLSPGEWLYWQLAGIQLCAHGMATGTGLYDPTAMDWAPDMLARFGLSPERLLPLGDAPDQAPRLARGFGELREALWCPAIGDGAASNLGSGADTAARLAINLGSSAAVREMRTGKRARAPFGLFAYRLDRHRYLLGGAISNSGNLREWAVRELGLKEGAALDRQLARHQRPDHGLTVLPFWTAERAPTWRDDLCGAVLGLSQGSSRLDILRATLEAGHHRLAQILERMKARSDVRLIVSGGGSRGRLNQQRLADVLGREIHVCAEREASLRGAAARAAELLDRPFPSPRVTGPVTPDAERSAAFARQRHRQSALERLLYPTD